MATKRKRAPDHYDDDDITLHIDEIDSMEANGHHSSTPSTGTIPSSINLLL
jgi:hypothetical protein